MEIIFSHPNYLWFLLSIPVLAVAHFLSIKYTGKKALVFANFPAIEKVTGSKFVTRNIPTLATRSVILLLAILAAAGSTLWYTTQTTVSDYVVIIDSSSSMLADDYVPNRLEAAKQAAGSFVDSLPSKTKIGIVSFAGTSYVDLQLTSDHQLVKQAIAAIEVKRVGGTDIGEAIITGVNLLSTTENPKVIVLLTDGRTNVGESVERAILYSNTNRVTVNAIGIGTVAGGRITDDVTLTLDEDSLKGISSQTSGQYLYAVDNNELVSAYKDIIELTNKKVSLNLSIVCLVIAIILLLVEWSLVNTKYKIYP